ncbi:gamma carbonic anhydrase family protein [Candidatus Bathyarchaeota archaeon]|nr:MAG: gamma carbonic anhydrase family protein [Candidatus Bathyarchaeota archaeon]
MSKVEFEGRRPKVDASVFLAPGSWVIGDVTLREGVNVWTGAVIRGDDDTVVIGARTTVLENCVVEAPTGSPVVVGDDTIISHGAIVHGARVGSRVLIGIGAIVLDGAEVGDGAIVGSGALVPPRAVIPPNQLALGVPAKPVREVRDAERAMVAREHERTLTKAEKYKAIYEEL